MSDEKEKKSSEYVTKETKKIMECNIAKER